MSNNLCVKYFNVSQFLISFDNEFIRSLRIPLLYKNPKLLRESFLSFWAKWCVFDHRWYGKIYLFYFFRKKKKKKKTEDIFVTIKLNFRIQHFSSEFCNEVDNFDDPEWRKFSKRHEATNYLRQKRPQMFKCKTFFHNIRNFYGHTHTYLR